MTHPAVPSGTWGQARSKRVHSLRGGNASSLFSAPHWALSGCLTHVQLFQKEEQRGNSAHEPNSSPPLHVHQNFLNVSPRVCGGPGLADSKAVLSVNMHLQSRHHHWGAAQQRCCSVPSNNLWFPPGTRLLSHQGGWGKPGTPAVISRSGFCPPQASTVTSEDPHQ